jgi:hypothetical protein
VADAKAPTPKLTESRRRALDVVAAGGVTYDSSVVSFHGLSEATRMHDMTGWWLVENGLAEITDDRVEVWWGGGRMVRKVAITEAGRQALAAARTR